MKNILNRLAILNSIPIIVGLALEPFSGLRLAYLYLLLPVALLGINTNHAYYNKKATFLPNIVYMCLVSLAWNGIDYLIYGISDNNVFNPDSWTTLYYALSLSLNFIIILCMGIFIHNGFRETFKQH